MELRTGSGSNEVAKLSLYCLTAINWRKEVSHFIT